MLNEDGKRARISLRITDENKELIKKIAKLQNRTISNWCESIILEKLNQVKDKLE